MNKKVLLIVSLFSLLILMVSACNSTSEATTETTGETNVAKKEAGEVTDAVESEAEAVALSTYPSQYATVADFEASGNSLSSFDEAPMLAELVAAGDLPSVEERLPNEPLVVQPLQRIGEYGGELAGPSTNPTCCGWDAIEMRLQKLVTIDTDLKTIIPNIAKDFEISDDQRVYTIYLREGHKWSDGEPFTSEDFRFYFEDILSNEELTPAPSTPWAQQSELPQFEIIDETTVRYTFAKPNPSLIVALGDEVNHRGFRPAHYFKQFHIDYNPQANALADEQGFIDWVELMNAKLKPYGWTWDMGSDVDPFAPTLNTFVFASEDSFGNKVYERNPYFFKVDTAGNQLPYTDKLRRILVEDIEVQDLKGIAGEYSHYGWGQLLSVPTYRDSEEVGGYRTAMITYERGNEYTFMFNFTNEDPVLREIFWDIRFRQAMSVAIDRNEINELVYFGLATPSQAAPTPGSDYYEPWMTDYFAEYDVDQANQLLDEMGLDQRDADGFRLRPDGETLLLNLQVSVPEEAWQKIGELVADYWNAVGVKTNYKLIEIGLYDELREGNAVDVTGWAFDTTDIGDVGNNLRNLRPYWGSRGIAYPWSDWLESDGTQGEEPPDEIKELWNLGDEFLSLPYGSDEQIALGKELNKMHFENLYVIGTIQRPPQPLLFKSNLCNTPPNDSDGLWSWNYKQWVMFIPEQWYYASDGECP